MANNIRNPDDRGDRPSKPQNSDDHQTQNSDIQNSGLSDSSSDEDLASDLASDGDVYASADPSDDVSWEEVEAILSEPVASSEPSSVSAPSAQPSAQAKDYSRGFTAGSSEPSMSAHTLSYGRSEYGVEASDSTVETATAPAYGASPPLALVETAFLASTASLLWLISYYLSIGPWMRILFPIPIALVHLRWGNRAACMAATVSGLLLSVLMGPYLSLLFLVPYGILGVQLGFLWQKKAGWGTSIGIGTIVATVSLFFRLWLLSTFLGEDLWVYLTGRITDLLTWAASILVNWGILGVGMLGQPNLHVVQLATVGMVVFSDFIYLFTIHLAAWLLLERVGAPISMPPKWVQVLLDEAK
ncbi:MAG: DUF2232 domain-containing protein [Cyanobacteria bacterium P01_F01_bin.150]